MCNGNTRHWWNKVNWWFCWVRQSYSKVQGKSRPPSSSKASFFSIFFFFFLKCVIIKVSRLNCTIFFLVARVCSCPFYWKYFFFLGEKRQGNIEEETHNRNFSSQPKNANHQNWYIFVQRLKFCTSCIWQTAFSLSQSASCYTSTPPLQLFGRGNGGGHYLSLFTYRGPRCAPRPRLVCHGPKLTLWQICHMLKVMKQVRKREAAAAAARWATSLQWSPIEQ